MAMVRNAPCRRAYDRRACYPLMRNGVAVERAFSAKLPNFA